MKIKYEWIFLEINGIIIHTFYTPQNYIVNFGSMVSQIFTQNAATKKLTLAPLTPKPIRI